MRKLAERVKAGDPAAARQFRQEAVQRAERAVAALPAPPEPAAVDRVVKAGLGRAVAGKVGGAVANFFKGLTGLGGESRGVSGWLGRRAQDLVTGLARMGRWALGAGVRLLGSVARAAGRFARSDTGKVVGLWAGSIAVAAAAVAAPVVAVNLGLIHWTSGLLLAPVAAAVGRMTYRVASRRAARVAPILGADRNPVREFAEPKDLALAGPDGRRAEELTAEARKDLTRLFAEGARAAVHRMMASGNPLGATVLFSDDELAGIAAGLSRTIATADLLGRARIRRRAKMAEKAAAGRSFAEGGDDPYHDFAEPVPVLVPAKAIEYVRGKVPEIDPGPDRYGSRLDRHATTMAIAADQTLLEKVKAAIVKELEGGGDATPDIDAILTNAGLNPDDPQYAEMIARTNVNDALNSGAADELQTPEMREAFPAWMYAGVRDSRTGEDHLPKIGKYYPAAANFADVRGPRIWNCRCSFAPVHKSQMADVRLEESW